MQESVQRRQRSGIDMKDACCLLDDINLSPHDRLAIFKRAQARGKMVMFDKPQDDDHIDAVAMMLVASDGVLVRVPLTKRVVDLLNHYVANNPARMRR